MKDIRNFQMKKSATSAWSVSNHTGERSNRFSLQQFNYLYSNSRYSTISPLKELILFQKKSEILRRTIKGKYVTFPGYFSHVYEKQMNRHLEDLYDKDPH